MHDCWQQSRLLCPFRSVSTVDQLRRHVQHYHVKETSYICVGHKQKRVARAIHDADSLALRRSADIIPRHVSPPLDHGRNNINGELRLVLTGRGAMCENKKAVSTDGHFHVRRVGNLYYTRCFANMVYCELVMHQARLERGHEARSLADCNVLQRAGQPRAREQQVHVEGGAGCLQCKPCAGTRHRAPPGV